MLQDVAVFDELTVYENIDYFCGLYVTEKKLRRQYVEEAIEPSIIAMRVQICSTSSI